MYTYFLNLAPPLVRRWEWLRHAEVRLKRTLPDWRMAEIHRL